ncbi:MAG: TRAP transporter TatT component family protein [Gammaproteobacteria bacterium]|nr:TRAP transporter TatT component family protein [Gammaproteobacteria bacterium]
MIKTTAGFVAILLLTGCASLISSATTRMADNITLAILNQNDLETVRLGAPAYLLMLDGLIEGDAENTDLLLAGAKLYSSYTSAFIEDEERAKRLAEKSFGYARTALCLEVPKLCQALPAQLKEFKRLLDDTAINDMPVLYGFATAWASWIQVNADDWNALAELPKLTVLFEQCIKLDENYDNGGSHIYLGVLSTQLPPSLGGKPEKGRAHFERANEISAGKNLMINVLMAQHYARMVFDQELHDQLLQAVLTEPAEVPGLTLINTIAKLQASELLEESVDFF